MAKNLLHFFFYKLSTYTVNSCHFDVPRGGDELTVYVLHSFGHSHHCQAFFSKIIGLLT